MVTNYTPALINTSRLGGLLLAILAAREPAVADGPFGDQSLLLAVLIGGSALVIIASAISFLLNQRNKFVPRGRGASSRDWSSRARSADPTGWAHFTRPASHLKTAKSAFAGRKPLTSHCRLNVRGIRQRAL